MRVLVVEDDTIAFDIVEEILNKHGITKIEHCSSVEHAINKLNKNSYNLLLLDIHLKDGNGTEIVEHVPSSTNVVFTTSDPTYAVEAFEVNALDYLIKPVTPERFANTLRKIEGRNNEQTILIKADFQYYKILVSEILYINSNKDYLTLHTKNKKYTFYGRMKNIINKLPDDEFMQCHRSYIVNLGKVKAYGQNYVVINDTEVQVSNSNKKEMMERLQHRIDS